jgi:hypothetical protein
MRTYTIKFWLILLSLLSNFCAQYALALPSDYKGQEDALASAEELNLIYSSLPQVKGDKFIVLSSSRQTETLKYYVLEKRAVSGEVSFLIVSTSQYGLVVFYQGDLAPFQSGDVPPLSRPIPLKVLQELALGLQ